MDSRGGGGAAKGIAHIGVLKAFEEEQIRVHCISGTSVGALVASYYAFGRPVESILTIGSALNLSKILNFTLERGGLFSTDAIREMIHRDLGDCLIEDANIPLAICATDIETGEQLKKADIVVSLDLSRYSLTNNAKCLEELYMEGYHPMKKKIQSVLWYKRMNVFVNLFKAAGKLLPLKVPEILKDLKRHAFAVRNRS
ncbi:patatin-like phospholipase family protein [Marinobacter sp. LV10R510-11A]|uniref:patatin-like phospholipase family protein n=1 Tax=Marinobacter sp. LV10R510-11A TaxID=1415568 RepID=UPI000BB980A6|nr:patatin-like phospholipase family protein [Marinobacter sp. LV10R510-11A]